MARKTGLEAMEPSKMAAVPKMDRVSVTFALMLDSFVIECNETTSPDVMLTCSLCTEHVCTVEEGDSLRVLLNTALAHTC